MSAESAVGVRTDIPRRASALAIKLFGPMEVRVHGELLPRLRSRKSLWLLALLTLRHNRPVERSWLAGTLWPEALPHQSLSNLAAVLSDLRKALGDQKTRLQAPTHQTILLELSAETDSPIYVDIAAFDMAIRTADLPSLEKAVELYRGPFLEGCPEEWVPQERRECEQKCLKALRTLAEAAVLAGDHNVARDYWQRALELDPYWDTARRGAMEALSALGDRSTALQVYRDFARLLNNDPHTAPDKETTALYQRLRTAVAAISTAAKTSSGKESRSNPGYLPHSLTALVGREDERLEVSDKLRQSRLVTLTGPGGIGKTRLALEVAAEIALRYADGAWFVGLEILPPNSNSSSVSQQIALRLGVKEAPGQTYLTTVTEHLRGKSLLLVFDNCEHVLAASAEVAAQLLRECAGARILATSRMALGITGEIAWAVPPLTVPDPAVLPQGQSALARILPGFDSVRLFAERAQAVRQTFAITGDNSLYIAQVCARLEGVPLAIELAAARMRTMTLPRMAAQLKDHWGQLDLLRGVNRTALSRQQTMRATLDWSFDLLTEGERLLLSRLSVFAGGCTLAAAESICANDGIETVPVPNLLESLVDKSLVRYEIADGENGRYVLLEVVRQYAAERLGVGNAAERVRARHRDWFLQFAEAMEPELHTVQNEESIRLLEADYGNLALILAWCETEPPEGQVGLRLTSALRWLWSRRANFLEGQKFLEGALARAGATAAPELRAKALTNLGVLSLVLNPDAAWAAYNEALPFYRKQGDQNEVAFVLSGLASVARHRDDYAEAQALYGESLILYQEQENIKGMAMCLLNLGLLSKNQAQLSTARTQYEESLRLFREAGDQRNVAVLLFALGQIASIRSDFVVAGTLLEESRSVFAELKDRRYLGIVNALMGEMAVSQGYFETAQHHLGLSADIFREIGDRSNIAWTLINLAMAYEGQGNTVLAHSTTEESLLLFEEIKNKRGIALAMHLLGGLARRENDPASARVWYERSLPLNLELGSLLFVAMNLEGFASLALLLPKPDHAAAVRLWGAASALREPFGIARPTYERMVYERDVAMSRSFLGEDAFSEAWEQGRAMTGQQAADYALKEARVGS